jgi:molybdopterin/thiamine biosynthesis adenylyltransferase
MTEEPSSPEDVAAAIDDQASASASVTRVTAERVKPADASVTVTDRQERIDGFDQATLESARVLLVGAGGVGGEVGEGLVRKGVGELVICDEDVVDATNLNRQKFRPADVGHNKAAALAERLAAWGTGGTDIVAHPQHFQDAVALGAAFAPNLVVCAPDNDAARLAVSDAFQGDVPVVITGLDTEANGGYAFVQSPTGPCFQCYRPGAGAGGACPAAPAVVDPTKVVAGVALYAVDAALMDRHRGWDAFEFHLSGVLPPRAVDVETRPDCPACGAPVSGDGRTGASE